MARQRRLSFSEAVNATPEIQNCHQAGLQAIPQSDRSKISLYDTRACEGSVDIDTCLTSRYPSDNRWDYCFCYKGEVFFVEVHTANSREISTVIRKLTWLKNWLNSQAPEINKLKAKNVTPYYWLQSSGYSIPARSRHYREAERAGILPIPRLELKH